MSAGLSGVATEPQWLSGERWYSGLRGADREQTKSERTILGQPRCESRSHADGVGGHEPLQLASWLVERFHPIDPTHRGWWPGFAARQLVCRGRAAYLREHMSDRIHCSACGARGPLRDFIRLVSPLDPRAVATFEGNERADRGGHTHLMANASA